MGQWTDDARTFQSLYGLQGEKDDGRWVCGWPWWCGVVEKDLWRPETAIGYVTRSELLFLQWFHSSK